jgi:amidophosphoribosyltransferase
MCGIVGIVGKTPVNQLLYDGLLLLQHRGQDAAGIATDLAGRFHLHKANGLVRDVFRTRHMRALPGNIGIGHVRYPTAGAANSAEEAQPFYVNAPYGIVLAHNGNLTNTPFLKKTLLLEDRRHINTQSDSEVLLSVFAHELYESTKQLPNYEWNNSLEPQKVFEAVARLHQRVEGAYACVALISGKGMVAFRDSLGIRPLVLGRQTTSQGDEYMIASESVALEGNGFELVRDIAPGETVFITPDGQFYSSLGHLSIEEINQIPRTPCVFEYVYFARPDSIIDGVSVYHARMQMGVYLAEKIKQLMDPKTIDVVIPVPDSSRPAAMELAQVLNLPYREGFIKNRYIGRTFIMPGQSTRKKSVRQKLNPVMSEFQGKTVLIVDDSIVRGTTSKEIVQMARDAGAVKVILASAAPPVRYPNVYGIDMPTRIELIATNKNDIQITQAINADLVVYQELADMEKSVLDMQEQKVTLNGFDSSCFNGCYVTGNIDEAYLYHLESERVKHLAQSTLSNTVTINGDLQNVLHLQRSILED